MNRFEYEALVDYLNGACQQCHGHGYHTYPTGDGIRTPVDFEEAPCRACGGSGQRSGVLPTFPRPGARMVTIPWLGAPFLAPTEELTWCSCNGQRVDGLPRPGCEGCNGTGYLDWGEFEPHHDFGLSPDCLRIAEQLAYEMVGWRMRRPEHRWMAEAVRAGLHVPTWWQRLHARLAFNNVHTVELEDLEWHVMRVIETERE